MTNGIGAARINASSDASFNDIPLSRWDGLSFGIMKDIEVLRRLREAGAPLTLSFWSDDRESSGSKVEERTMTEKKLKQLKALLIEFRNLIGNEQPLAAFAITAVVRMVECYIEG